MQGNAGHASSRPRAGFWLVLGLIVLTVVWRVLAIRTGAWNASPLMAIAFGGAMLLGYRFFWVPAAALILGDLCLAWHYSAQGFSTGNLWFHSLLSCAFFVLVAFVAGFLSTIRVKLWPSVWLGTLVCSLGFYLLANTGAWALEPLYPKNLAGWWQSQTTGLPQYSPPSWVFLRNSLLADTAWCGLAGGLWLLASRMELVWRRKSAFGTAS